MQRVIGIVLSIFGLLCSVHLHAVQQGLQDLRYQVYLDSNSDIEAPLSELAEMGSLDAQLMYADLLSGKAGTVSISNAAMWYKRAYDHGRGAFRSLESLAKLSSQYEWINLKNRDFFIDVLSDISSTANPQTVSAVLEVFLAYPDLFEEEHVVDLIDLHKRACIEVCLGDLYKAVKISYFNHHKDAVPYFVEAAISSSRAVRLYFDSLPEERKVEEFTLFSEMLKKRIEELHSTSKFAVANRLRVLSPDFNSDVIFWLDSSSQSGIEDAYAVKAEYMMTHPLNFSYQGASKVIDQVSLVDLQKSKLLQASLYIVREWKRLQPIKSYEILSALDDQGVIEATIGLGDLYSMGGLDQVDQQKAIQTYFIAAEKGASVAYQKVATIYRSGRGIVNDNVKAFGYGKLAAHLGNEASNSFLETLAQDMDVKDLERGNDLFQQFRRDLVKDEVL